MLKKIHEFHACAKDLVARNVGRTKTFIGGLYFIGDGIVGAIPAFENGSFRTIINGNPDWNLLASAYLNHPLPAIASGVFIASAVILMKRRFALGHALIGVGGAILTWDLYQHNKTIPTLTYIPGLVGASLGAAYPFLERHCGNSKYRLLRVFGSPKKMAGFFLLASSGPTCAASLINGLWGLGIATAHFFTGNVTSTLLPRDDDQKPDRPAAQKGKRSFSSHALDRW